MKAVFKREFKAYFTSPLGYVILAALSLFSGIFFAYMYSAGYGDIAYIFSNMFVIIMFAVPILTMRLISEDRKQKVDQALITAPVKLYEIVLGKFLAAFVMFALGFATSLIFQTIFAFSVSLNWLLYFCNLLGILLYGGALIAIGVFISSLTESQVVSAVLSLVASLFIGLMDSFASMINNTVVTAVVEKISFSGRYETFSSGIIDFSNVIFFLSIIAVFLFFTTAVLDRKRWA